MGAVIFWTVLGLANSRVRPVPAAKLAGSAQEDCPVAKAGAMDTQSSIR